MRRSNSIRSNKKALRLDVSQHPDQKDSAETVLNPQSVQPFSPRLKQSIFLKTVISGMLKHVSGSVRWDIASSVSRSSRGPSHVLVLRRTSCFEMKGTKRRGKRKHATAYVILDILIVIGDLSEVLIPQCPRQELRSPDSNPSDVACISPNNVLSFAAGPLILVIIG